MKLSIVMPVLNEAAAHRSRAHRARTLPRARRRGDRRRWRQQRWHARTGGAARRPRDIGAAWARHANECRRGGRKRRRAAVPARRHASSPTTPTAWCSMRSPVRAREWGRFDVRFDGGGLLRVVGAAMNLRSRLTGIATGDQALFVTRAAFAAAGGFPPIALMEDVALSARLKRLGPPVRLARARDHLGSPLADTGNAAHGAADVGLALALFPRCRSGQARAPIRLCRKLTSPFWRKRRCRASARRG